MKTKMYVLAALLLTGALNAILAETKVKIYPAEGDDLPLALGYTDKTHIFVSKDILESAVPGNIIRVHGWNEPGDGAHKMLLGYQVCSGTVFTNNAYLPGGEIRDITWTVVDKDSYYDFYLTKDMLDAIRYGGPNCAGSGEGRDLRIYGEGITANVVDLVQPGLAGSFHEPFKTVWKGLFSADSWSTMEINKTTLAPYGDFSNVRAIRFYHDANRIDFVMNIIQAWDPRVLIADQNDMTKTSEYFELPLDETMRGKFTAFMESGEGTLKIQCNKESGAAFHLTDIVFVTYSPDGCSNCFYVY